MILRQSVLVWATGLKRTRAALPLLCKFRQQKQCRGLEETGQLVPLLDSLSLEMAAFLEWEAPRQPPNAVSEFIGNSAAVATGSWMYSPPREAETLATELRFIKDPGAIF